LIGDEVFAGINENCNYGRIGGCGLSLHFGKVTSLYICPCTVVCTSFGGLRSVRGIVAA